MAKIFISHSSRNNDKAIEVRDWLAAKGWTDVFLDLDPKRGIVAGQRWKEALQKAAHRCEVVLALVSPEWLASGWCKSEIDTARLLGKKMIVALVGIDKARVPVDLTDEQFIDLSADPQAYPRLEEGLKRAGLDPTSFPFDPKRRPYPGLTYLEEQDAAVFFGRDAQIVRGLDEIRRLVRTGITRMLVILGASGSGKSSFLRAGLWPRLKRDDRAWLPLPILRPERAAISGKYGLAEALRQIMSEPRFVDGIRQRGLPQSRADVQDFLEKTDDGLEKLFAALRDIAQAAGLSNENAAPPTILLALDQGEELFNEEGGDEARRFIEILTKTLTADPRALAILAMRSDSFPLVQVNPSLAALPKDTLTLDMMLEGSYRAVIEGPARLVEPTLTIDPQLTDALLKDISGQDALPLLAFTLAYLYENYAADNALTLSGYDKIERVKGVIKKTVRQAFAEATDRGEAPKDEEAQFALARSAFIPHLAQFNAAGQAVRRVTAREKIPEKARALIDRFVDQRLLIRERRKDAEGHEVDVVEVAHEALLRQPPFSEWLKDDWEFLVWRERLSQARAAFKAKQRGLLADLELDKARNWMQTRAKDEIESDDQAFIRDSIAADDKRRAEEAAQQKRHQRLLVGALVVFALLAVLAGGFAIFGFSQKNEAETTNHQRGLLLEEAARSDQMSAQDRVQRGEVAEALAYWAGAIRYEPTWSLPLEAAIAAVLSPPIRHSIMALTGHTGRVSSAVFSPDGRRVLTGSEDKTARLWEAGTGKLLTTFQGHTGTVRSAVFSPDGHRVLTGSEDKTARLWEADTGKLLTTFQGHTGTVRIAVFSPDGRRVLTAGSEDKTARLWEADSGRLVTAFVGHTGAVGSAVFSPDGDRVLTASGDKTARLWEADTGKPLTTFVGHAGTVNSAVFSPDGRRVLTASDDQTARLWEADSGRLVAIFRGHENAVRSAMFSPDGRRVLTASWDFTARLWEPDSGRLVAVFPTGGMVRSAVFSPDGRRVLTASANKTARLWGTDTGQLLATFQGHTDSVGIAVFSSDGRWVLTASGDKTARLWEADTAKLLATFQGHTGPVNSVAFGPSDGRRVLTGSGDNSARLWDADTGKPLTAFERHAGPVNSAVFSPDGRRVLTGSADKTARLWEAESGRLVTAFVGHTDAVKSVAFSPDGRRVLTGSADKTARLWEADTGKPLTTFQGHTGPVNSAVFSPDGHRVLTGSEDNTARLWDADTGKPLTAFVGHTGTVWSAVFSPDGRRVLTASWDFTARLWEADTGKPLTAFVGHRGNVVSAVFSPDGHYVLTGSWDKTARLWEAESGQLLATFQGHTGVVTSAAFSPDGRRVLTGSGDGTARLWVVLPSGMKPPVWSGDFLIWLGGKQIGREGEIETLSGIELQAIEDRLRPHQNEDTDLARLLRWQLLPPEEQPIDPYGMTTRKQAADLIIRPDMSEPEALHAYELDPWHPLVDLALAGFEQDPVRADFLRRYSLARLPGDPKLQERAVAFLRWQGKEDLAQEVLGHGKSPIPANSPSPTSQPSPTPTPFGADWFAKAKRYLDAEDYAKAFPLLQKAADAGDAVAMNSLGDLYYGGNGVAQDYAQAHQWYQKAADSGNASAMTNLGWLYEKGMGVTQDYSKAREWYQKAADSRETYAMYNLGVLYANGNGAAQDYSKAREWYQKAADAGSAEAKEALLRLPSTSSPIPTPSPSGAELFAKAKRYLGVKDYADALPLLQKAAEDGDAEAMNDLGVLYGRGRGVAQDYAQAFQWYKKAADSGNTMGMTNLGYLYQNGRAVARDYAQAFQWYQKAANAGNAIAMTDLGWLYERGEGVGQDYAQARYWYQKAADAGYAQAKQALSRLPSTSSPIPTSSPPPSAEGKLNGVGVASLDSQNRTEFRIPTDGQTLVTLVKA